MKILNVFGWTAFTELCFDSLIIEKDVCCKRKPTSKSLKGKCAIICHIEKSMANKKTSERFAVPKNTISRWMKNKEKV